MPETTYPIDLGATLASDASVHFRLEGSWNKKVFQINSDGEIPLEIDAYFDNVYHYTVEQLRWDMELHSNQVKLTPYAEDHGVDDSYIIGLSAEQFRCEITPEGSPEHPILPKWALIGSKDAIRETQDGNWELTGAPMPMGARATDNDFTVISSYFYPNNCHGKNADGDFFGVSSDALNALGSYLGNQLGIENYRVARDFGTWNSNIDITWKTELPVFDTDAHLLAYIQSGGRDTTGLLNGEQPVIQDPTDEESYDYYLNDTFTLYQSYGLSYQKAQRKNYRLRITMKKRGRVLGGLLALVNKRPFEPEAKYPRKYKLIGDEIRSVSIQTNTGWTEYTGDDIKTLFFYRTTAGSSGSDYCKVENWATNIPYKDGPDSENWARQFLQTGNPQGATNIKKIIPKDTPITPGTPVEETPIPTPGFTISNGGRILGLTAAQVNTFYSKIFDSANIQALLDGTQLFGANQINAIKDLFYIPVKVDDIATCSTTQHIFLGSYDLDMGSAVKWVTNNNKLISCGTVTFNETFGSYLDYEPFCNLFIWLPFCGIHKLEVSKYINQTIRLRYAVSVFDGTCVAFLSTVKNGHDVVLDSFQGNMSVHRPLQANDQQRQTAAIAQGILQTGAQVVGTLGTVAAGAGAIGSAASLGGIEAGIAAGVGRGVASGLPGANGAIRAGANTLQTAVDAPMSTRGALAGMLTMFDTMIPTFIVARLNSIEPANELQIVGKPSATGGLVSSFSGFLKTSAFDMSNFPGTVEEAQEIQRMFAGGVYID